MHYASGNIFYNSNVDQFVMAAIVSCAINLVRTSLKYFFPESKNSFLIDRSPYGLPLSARRHQIITDEELANRRLVIIGDVHGCYDELVELLDKCRVHHGNILPIFVGDLVNKGPKNAEVVKLVRSLGAFSVRGNHDEVVLREWQRYREGLELRKEYSWLNDLSKEDLDWMFDLPYTISIPSRNMIVVHAGLVPGVPIEEQDLNYLIHIRDVTFDTTNSCWVGSKKSTPNSKPWASVWTGPYHVYFGHDAIRLLQEYTFATGLDTGCVYGGSLTAVMPEIEGRSIVHIQSHAVYRKPGK